ncbi:MAG TPA: DUF5946 family protein [Candidatus Angelobacter sp.]|nr:DUF5946 family protein [Candidatus Angelobacter sp.]
MPSDEDLFNELAYYTLSHPEPRFIHQHVVDAQAAQQADERTKAIKVVFALVGLYLFLEKDFTGRQVQQTHMRLARRRKQWPRLPLPSGPRGDITVSAVMALQPGPARDEMVRAWCASVWQTWQESRPQIVRLLKQELDIS